MNHKLRVALIILSVIASLIGVLWSPKAIGAQQVVRDVTVNFLEVTRLSNLRTEARAYVTVTDLNGAPVVGLSADNFVLSEDGMPVSDFDVQEASGGIWVVLLMDTTTSMREAGLKAAKDAADSFVASMATPDQVALYEFQEESYLLVDFTYDHNNVRNAIAKLELMDRWTCLYDAASTAVKKAMEIPQGRRAVVLLTDGKDDRAGKPCSTILVDDLIALAYGQRVPIYVVGLGRDIDEALLKRIAEKTGGAYWSAPQPEDLAEAYRQVAKLLRSQYVVRFESTKAAGEHAVVIRVDYRGQQSLDAASFLIPALTPIPAATDTSSPEPVPTSPPPPPDGRPDWLYPFLGVLGIAVLAVVAVVFARRRQTGVPVGEEEVVWTEDVPSLGTLTVLESLTLPEGKPYQLYGDSVTIGRGSANDIDIPDKPVSRKHAELRYQDGEFYLYDKGSTFGTQVNAVEVPPQGIRLADGDLVQLGTRTKLRFNRVREETEDQDLTQDIGLDEDRTDDWVR